MIKIVVAEEFSKLPGGRYEKDGEFSGERFRNELLEPNYLKAIKEETLLLVDLDGAFGYPSSFLQESFGGLARKYDGNEILKTVIVKTQDETSLANRIIEYIVEEGKTEEQKNSKLTRITERILKYYYERRQMKAL